MIGFKNGEPYLAGSRCRTPRTTSNEWDFGS